MLKTTSGILIAPQQHEQDTEVNTRCKAESALAFNRRAVWQDNLPLKLYWWNTELKNLMWGQWVKVLAYLRSAWNCVQRNSGCHKVLTQARGALLRDGETSTQFMDMQEMQANWRDQSNKNKPVLRVER